MSSTSRPSAGGVFNAVVASQRFAAVSAESQPQRAGSYHGDFRRPNKNRFADSPLRAVSMDAAGRVRARTHTRIRHVHTPLILSSMLLLFRSQILFETSAVE